MADYKLAVNEENKATELPLCRITGSAQQNPHMRAFWGSTCSFFLAFLGWFALAPLGLEVASSMGICENQLYPPLEHPKRKAYLKYKNLKTELFYCKYGKNDAKKPTDCKPDPAGVDTQIYDPSVLAKCVCTGGTHCKTVLADAGVAAVGSTIFVRVALGTLLERFGPVNVQACLLTFGAIWVYAAAAISAPWNYTVIRFFIGCCGATFVTNQFWCSLMFAPNIVGTANATAAGWGNLGGGVTQVFMIVVLFNPFKSMGMEPDTAWRVSMVVPATLFLICAGTMKLLCWDTPTKKRFTVDVTGKTKDASMWDYVEALKDLRVTVMIMQYSACFGTELAMNNQLATHFRTYFQMNAASASSLAASFGGMNLFARSLGGIFSDFLYHRMGWNGRLWAQFIALFFEGVFLFAFGCVDNSQEWYVALIVLVCFSLFVQMAEGTSYGIVPFLNREQLAVVSAMVGAGGNLGAVIAGKCFYAPIEDALLPFQIHAGYVLFWALLSPVYWFLNPKGWTPPGGEEQEAAAASGEQEKKDGQEYSSNATIGKPVEAEAP